MLICQVYFLFQKTKKNNSLNKKLITENQIDEDIFDYIKEWVIKNDQIDYFSLYGKY